jgi:hypothetical protein
LLDRLATADPATSVKAPGEFRKACTPIDRSSGVTGHFKEGQRAQISEL